MGFSNQSGANTGTGTTRSSVGRTVVDDIVTAFDNEWIVPGKHYVLDEPASLIERVRDNEPTNGQGVNKRLAAMRSSAANWQRYAADERSLRHYDCKIVARMGYGDDLAKFYGELPEDIDPDTEYRWFEMSLVEKAEG